jgi:hypothetical protein
MPHKKGHDPQIKKAPSKFTGLVRNIKNSPNAPYPFIRQIGATAAFLAPVPLGKSKMVQNMASFAKQAKKVPPISKNAFSNASKQYMSKAGVGGSNVASAVKQMKEYKVGGKLYGHFTKSGKLTNKYVPVVGKPGKKVSVPKSSKTKQVSYVNPRISMTKAQRDKAGY